MSLKYRIPIMLMIVFVLNIVLLFLFVFFYTVPDLQEGIAIYQEQAVRDVDEIAAYLEDKSYDEAIAFVTRKTIEDRQLSFVLENVITKEQILVSEPRWGGMNFSAMRSVDLAEGSYALFLRSDVDLFYSLDGTILRLAIIECFVLFASLVIVACIMHSFYVKPLKHLAGEIERFHKTDTTLKNSERSDEIGSLERSFFHMTEELRAEKENQSHIIASISHDIKTPLTSIMGFSERLIKKDLDKDKQATYLKSIYRQSKNIEAIVDEFDEYLSFSMNSVNTLQKLSVSFVCESLKDEYSEICENQGVVLELQNQCLPGSSVNIDVVKMRRVFANLIGNSMRHNEIEGLEIRVAFENIADDVQITVSDNGKGVPEPELAHIFEPFFTSDKSRKMSGLGLSICSQIIKSHGGDIKAMNIQGGFSVIIHIPVWIDVPSGPFYNSR
ncbi:hypothetical protein Gferi_26990 [Geosporobacter ferrireducens]|uniref:histidine kinase n=2 Tax=Geosporobacter ferrireducens TaxID=1424294 RepID=A0A1D8GPK8_9FIRM|nr:hypothetical protein Gferi_26990 [Geosporobacter ferrireducens]